MTEPSAHARQIAFEILARHPEYIRDDVIMNDLIDAIASKIDEMAAESVMKVEHAIK